MQYSSQYNGMTNQSLYVQPNVTTASTRYQQRYLVNAQGKSRAFCNCHGKDGSQKSTFNEVRRGTVRCIVKQEKIIGGKDHVDDPHCSCTDCCVVPLPCYMRPHFWKGDEKSRGKKTKKEICIVKDGEATGWKKKKRNGYLTERICKRRNEQKTFMAMIDRLKKPLTSSPKRLKTIYID